MSNTEVFENSRCQTWGCLMVADLPDVWRQLITWCLTLGCLMVADLPDVWHWGVWWHLTYLSDSGVFDGSWLIWRLTLGCLMAADLPDVWPWGVWWQLIYLMSDTGVFDSSWLTWCLTLGCLAVGRKLASRCLVPASMLRLVRFPVNTSRHSATGQQTMHQKTQK